MVDSHIHLYDPRRAGGVHWPPRDNVVLYAPHLPQQFRAATEGLGVAGAVVIEANARADDNRWVFDLAKTEPLILAYIGRLTPGQADFANEFEQYAENPTFRGLRVSVEMLGQGLGQKNFDKDLQRVAERRLTLDLVGGGSLLPFLPRITKVAPGLRTVIDHLPFENSERALREAAAMPHVYAKISDVLRRANGRVMTEPDFYRQRLDMLWELFGEDRVIYGSNWPVSDLMAPYPAVLKVVADYVNRRGRVAVEKYFWKNSLAAYQWQHRGAANKLR